MGPNAIISIPVRERQREFLRQKMMSQWDHGGRDSSEVVTRQGMPGATRSLRKQGKNSLLEPLEVAWLS